MYVFIMALKLNMVHTELQNKRRTTLYSSCQPDAGRLKVTGDPFEQVGMGFFCQGDGPVSNNADPHPLPVPTSETMFVSFWLRLRTECGCFGG